MSCNSHPEDLFLWCFVGFHNLRAGQGPLQNLCGELVVTAARCQRCKMKTMLRALICLQ